MSSPKAKSASSKKSPEPAATKAPKAKANPPGQKLLGVVLRKGTWLMFGFFKEVLQGIQRVAFSQGYSLVIINPSQDGGLDLRTLMKSLNGHVRGLLLVAPEADPDLLGAVAKAGLPAMVLYGRHPDLSFVQVDNEGGAFAATEHLISLGHERIAFLNGPANAAGAQERMSGYLKALAKHGLPRREDYVIAADYDQARGYKAMKEFLHRSPPPTAVFAANDYMALGAISAAQDEGLAVPGDVAVVGFDDLEMPSLTFRAPPLTTVRQPVYEIAKEGTEGLIFAIEGRITEVRQRVFPSQLIVRSTCGASARKPASSV